MCYASDFMDETKKQRYKKDKIKKKTRGKNKQTGTLCCRHVHSLELVAVENYPCKMAMKCCQLEARWWSWLLVSITVLQLAFQVAPFTKNVPSYRGKKLMTRNLEAFHLHDRQ